MGQALVNGDIDAFLSGEPYPSQAVQEGYGRILSYPYFDDSIGTINAAMIVTEDTIKNKPERVQDLVNAHVDATRMLNENKEKWLDKSAEFGTDKALLEISADNIELCSDIDDTFIQNTRNLADRMKELGMIDNVPDIDAMFDLSFWNRPLNGVRQTDGKVTKHHKAGGSGGMDLPGGGGTGLALAVCLWTDTSL